MFGDALNRIRGWLRGFAQVGFLPGVAEWVGGGRRCRCRCGGWLGLFGCSSLRGLIVSRAVIAFDEVHVFVAQVQPRYPAALNQPLHTEAGDAGPLHHIVAQLDEFLALPPCAGVWARSGAGPAESATHSGADRALVECGGLEYFVSPETFFQVNRHLWGEMIRALDRAIGDEPRVAVDLYCGVGFFTLALARRAGRVVGVEENPASIRLARAAAEAAGIHNVDFLLSSAEAFARSSTADPPDVLVVDPPRAGVSPEVMDGFSRTPRILYFSCDAATFARDLRRFFSAGYRLSSVRAFDLFPQTAEVESLAVLERG